MLDPKPTTAQLSSSLSELVKTLGEVRAGPAPEHPALNRVAAQVDFLRKAHQELVGAAVALIVRTDQGANPGSEEFDDFSREFTALCPQPEMRRGVLLSLLDEEERIHSHNMHKVYGLLAELGTAVRPAIPRLLEALSETEKSKPDRAFAILDALRAAQDPTLIPVFDRYLGFRGANSDASICAMEALADFGQAAAQSVPKIRALTTHPMVYPHFESSRTEALGKILLSPAEDGVAVCSAPEGAKPQVKEASTTWLQWAIGALSYRRPK